MAPRLKKKRSTPPPREVKPLAFLSYAQFNDKHDSGWVTQFRRQLSGEVQAQTGVPFDIFQDRKDIRWGENWRQRIKTSIDSATFFITILTPSFLNSEECLKELRQFLAHEKKLKRNDLILSVHYIPCKNILPRLDPKLTKAIRDHQLWDWTALRFESLEDLKTRKVLADLAKDIRDAIDRGSDFT